MAAAVKTSETHPLQVFWVDAAAHGGVGRLGLTFAPGKRGGGLVTGSRWARSMEADLDRLSDHYGVHLLVSLMEPFEYQMLGIGGLFEAAERRGIRVRHLPIVDVNVPTVEQAGAVESLVRHVRSELLADRTVVVHCRGGRGRTGTIVSLVLTTFGWSAHEAIAGVRQAQPGAVDTQEQADDVRTAARRLAQTEPATGAAVE